ncbi:MAG: succinate dehydrogenase assembly factor 2 [Pseudomonadota bacterium]
MSAPEETEEARYKRLLMRASRRGIKEMDIILGRFASARLRELDGAEIDSFDALLWENDQDLYAWVTGQSPTPDAFQPIIAKIAVYVGAERPKRL